jgi:hypothetical protein
MLALAGCESMDHSFGNTFEDSFEEGGHEFGAQLSGADELSDGDPDGTGIASIAVADTGDRICTTLEVRNIGQVTSAHIHRGSSRANGAPMVTLDLPDGDWLDDCVAIDRRLLSEIRGNPSGFYVNVHTAEFPDGAIRGQISPGAD